MGNRPSEYNGVNCIQCGRGLPPCKDFDDFHVERIDRIVRVDDCYVYNGGQYYRTVGGHGYYCPDDFWRPRNDYLRRQEEERRRREERERQRREQEAREREQARLREIARQQELERLRLEEQRRQEEERRRQQEAREEAARQEALRLEEEQRRLEEELARERQQQVSAKFVQWSRSDEAHEQEQTQTETYKPFLATETSRQELYEVEGSSYDANIPDDATFLESNYVEEITTVSKELVESVQYSIDVAAQHEELNGWWLKASQTLLLTYYMQSNSFSDTETDLLLDFLAFLQHDLSGKECLTLADTFSSLVETRPSDFFIQFHLNATLPLTAKVSTLLLQRGEILKENNLWMQRCLYTLVAALTTDEMLPKMYIEVTCNNWSGSNWLDFFEQCRASSLPEEMQKHVLHLIQTYCVQPEVILKGLLKGKHHSIVYTLEEEIKSEENKLLVDIFHEIRESKLVDEDILSHVERLAKRVYELLGNININLDFDRHFQSTLDKSVSTFKKLADQNSSVTDEEIAESMITLMCACKKVKPFYPRRTQMVSLLLLLLSSQRGCNRLLEVMTGEGKSLVVVLFATILGVQGKHIDVVTSSPILALRDAEEYAGYYHLFQLSVTHNTDLNRPEDCKMDDIKKECYRNNIVYGTVGNFAGDILREEFEQKRIRSGRRFDAVIVDEVDMLMLDEGVQFTYLSHDAAILHHIEPVISAVWGLIGPLRLATTVSGQILYAGHMKLFTEAIYECLDPEFSLVQTHSQVLASAMELGIITPYQFERLLSDDQEERRLAVAELTKANALALISGLEDYENMPEFKAYTINSQGLLEPATFVANEDSAEKLLLLDNGLACILNAKEEIIERGSEILKVKLCFSDEEGEANIKLPSFMKDFVLHQIPLYVDNAIRALHMEEDREYAITNGKIIPVDFQNSGVMELNKKWGGGLQQMLELKHNLSLSSMSLVTNFMSNVEFFSRYKREGGIYGMSGTLGLDSHSNTTMLLNDLYDTKVCSIPTFKVRKLFEKPAIIVENNEQWFKQIVTTVNEESREEASWKKGRAVLILCEDIKTAEDLRDFVIETEGWQKEKVYLYAHSNSKQLSSIKKKLGPGEVIIATNLAGRGTNIKVIDEVNQSGGLLCLVTFLARNRRVELQAFGRTARSGKPGSVRCILNYSSMPSQYEGLEIQDIRKLRAEEESLRLQKLINNDVKEVQLREVLFKSYCRFLQDIHQRLRGRDDKRVVLSSLNENWGQWLQMRNEQIELLKEEQLLIQLRQATAQWYPRIPSNRFEPVDLPVANFYHYVQFGNQLLIKDSDNEVERACRYFAKSIEMEPRYAAIAFYNRAYSSITAEVDDYKQKALADIKAAVDCLNPYIGEISEVYQCSALVRQVRDIKEREADDYGEVSEKVGDFDAQVQARFEILRFLRQKMEEAIQKIQEIDGDIIAKPVGIFSLIPNADYCTNVELARMWTLGIEVVYSIEKKPRFCWEGLVVFFLGIAEIVGGVLLTVFTVGAAAQIGMALIGEGISDCIDGIEGMVTGEFSWTEWAITKATGLAISLISGGVSRLASTGLKAIKAGYKIAKVGRQLKAIPKIVKNTAASAAKKNLKTAAKYVAKEAVMQGVSYAQCKFMNMAVAEIAELIGEKLKERFMGKIQAAFLTGYLGEVVSERYIKELNLIDRARSEVSKSMSKRAKWFFTNVGDLVTSELDSNTEVKERLSTSSLSLFQEVSQKSKELRGYANIAQAAVTGIIVTDAVASLGFLVEEFPQKMEEVCRRFNEKEGIVMSPHTDAKYSYDCARKLKTDLADHAGEVFATAVAALLQGKLGPLINQYQMTNKIGRLNRTVVGKYVLKVDRTMQDIQSMQHANYIRSVGADFRGDGPPSNITVAKLYAKRMDSANSAGSLMELRVAAEHYGQKVTIYHEKNGKLVKDSSIDPQTRKTQEEIQLVYTPPSDPKAVGHYDVIVGGTRRRVYADNSNCLFHAFAYGQNPNLSSHQLKLEAGTLRQTVVTTINANPHKFAEHIKLRVEMDNLRRGNRFAMVGAGTPNPYTKVLTGFYHQRAVGNEIHTMYEQANGVVCKAVRRYNQNLTVVNKIVQETDPKMTSFEVHMDGLNLDDNRGMRCQHTKTVVGQIKRPGGNPLDSEVSYHLCPSRAGANAGDQYANAIPASPDYNNLEKLIWTTAMEDCIGSDNFSMTVKGYCGPVVQDYKGKQDVDAAMRQKLENRYKLIEAAEPRAYRLEDPCTFTVHLPASATQKEMDDIAGATHDKNPVIGVELDYNHKAITFYMPKDEELFTPKDLAVSGLQPNGELYPGELTNCKPKQKNLTVGIPPRYRTPPRSTKTAQDKLDFEDNFNRWSP